MIDHNESQRNWIRWKVDWFNLAQDTDKLQDAYEHDDKSVSCITCDEFLQCLRYLIAVS